MLNNLPQASGTCNNPVQACTPFSNLGNPSKILYNIQLSFTCTAFNHATSFYTPKDSNILQNPPATITRSGETNGSRRFARVRTLFTCCALHRTLSASSSDAFRTVFRKVECRSSEF